MDAARREQLIAAGVDVDAALERLMGSEALLERFLGKFLADANFQRLTQALDAGDAEAAVTASHSLKGVAGNLSMTALHGLLTDQVAALRAGDLDRARALMAQVVPAYEGLVQAIGGGGGA